VRTVYDVAEAIFARDGTYSHTIGTVQDITDRREIEDNLRRSERRFRRVIDSNMVGVVFWGPDGAVHDANDACLAILGYTRDDLSAGRLNWKRMTPPEHANLDEAANRRLQEQGVTGAYEKELIRKDGSRVPVLIGGASLENEPGQAVSFVLDLTQQRKIEERLRQGQKLQALGQLTGGVAHEFNNLLMIIMGNAEMLTAKLEGNPRLLEMAALIANSAKRAAELTGRLLAVARRQPLRPAAEQQAAPDDGMVPLPQGTERVLLVEDDDLVRAYAESQLRLLGYAVVAVNDGQAAVQALRRDPFDLLFTDVVLPGGLNGRQLADQARELQPQIKILYTSGYTEDAVVHDGRLDPGVHVISKPYRQQDLAFKLRRVLRE
jgi:PAS domain S-box-containing protein